MQPRQFNQFRFRKKDRTESREIDYISFLPLLTGGLIFLGAVRLIYYYYGFDINIVSYLEFSEIITSFLDRTITITFLIVYLFSAFYESQIKEKKKETDSKIDYSNISLRKNYKIAIFLVISLVACIYLLIKYVLTNEIFIQFVVLLLLPAGIIIFSFRRLYTKHSLRYVRQLTFIGIFLLISVCFLDFITFGEYDEVAKKQKYLGTTIAFNNDVFMKDSSHVFVSDSSNFYIGKTANYIFVYHKKEKTATIYPMSTVLKIDLKVKH